MAEESEDGYDPDERDEDERKEQARRVITALRLDEIGFEMLGDIAREACRIGLIPTDEGGYLQSVEEWKDDHPGQDPSLDEDIAAGFAKVKPGAPPTMPPVPRTVMPRPQQTTVGKPMPTTTQGLGGLAGAATIATILADLVSSYATASKDVVADQDWFDWLFDKNSKTKTRIKGAADDCCGVAVFECGQAMTKLYGKIVKAAIKTENSVKRFARNSGSRRN